VSIPDIFALRFELKYGSKDSDASSALRDSRKLRRMQREAKEIFRKYVDADKAKFPVNVSAAAREDLVQYFHNIDLAPSIDFSAKMKISENEAGVVGDEKLTESEKGKKALEKIMHLANEKKQFCRRRRAYQEFRRRSSGASHHLARRMTQCLTIFGIAKKEVLTLMSSDPFRRFVRENPDAWKAVMG